jgi:hypothetical protein
MLVLFHSQFLFITAVELPHLEPFNFAHTTRAYFQIELLYVLLLQGFALRALKQISSYLNTIGLPPFDFPLK